MNGWMCDVDFLVRLLLWLGCANGCRSAKLRNEAGRTEDASSFSLPLSATAYGKINCPFVFYFHIDWQIIEFIILSAGRRSLRHTHFLVAMRYAIIGVTSSSVLCNHLAHNWQPCRIERADNNTIKCNSRPAETVGSVSIENRIFCWKWLNIRFKSSFSPTIIEWPFRIIFVAKWRKAFRI